MEHPVSPVYLDDQVLKVSQVSQEALDVQGLMVPKEKEEILALEASLDHKVSLDQEEILAVQVLQDRVSTEAGERTVLQGVLEAKASLEM